MTTFVGTQSDFSKVLGALVKLTYDVLEAYNTAINRLESDDLKSTLQSYRETLKKNIKEIDGALIDHGKNIPSGASLKQYLTKGKVALADMVGDDGSILRALITTDQDLYEALRRAVHHEDRRQEMEDILENALESARQHNKWLQETGDRLSG